MVPIMLFAKTIVIYCQRRGRPEPGNEQIEMEELQEENDEYNDMASDDKDSNEGVKRKRDIL